MQSCSKDPKKVSQEFSRKVIYVKNFWALIISILKLPGYKMLLVVLIFIALTLFLWFPQMNLFYYIIAQAPLSLLGKIDFIVNYYPRVLTNITSPIVFSMIVFSILTAISILLLIFMIRTSNKMHTHQKMHGGIYSGVAAVAVGAHVLSCGGTLLLASVFPAIAGASTILGGRGVTINTWLSTGANIIGIAIVIYLISKLVREIVSMLMADSSKSVGMS